MSRPGTRHFIGPLTPAQQRRRERARWNYQQAAEISYTRLVSMRDAFAVLREERRRNWTAFFP